MAVPEFDRAEAADFGAPYFVGQDEAGNEVYILGLNGQTPLCVRAMLSLAGQLGLADRILLVNTLTAIGLTTRVGGFISKKLRCPRLGKPRPPWGSSGLYPGCASWWRSSKRSWHRRGKVAMLKGNGLWLGSGREEGLGSRFVYSTSAALLLVWSVVARFSGRTGFDAGGLRADREGTPERRGQSHCRCRFVCR